MPARVGASLRLRVRWRRVLAVDHDGIGAALGQFGEEVGADRRCEQQRPQPADRTGRQVAHAETIERLATSSSITSVAPPPIELMRASRYIRSTGVSRM